MSAEQNISDDLSHSLIECLYSYEFKSADSLLLLMEAEKGITYEFCKLHYIWWQVVSGAIQKEELNLAIRQVDETIELFEEIDGPVEDEVFVLATAYAYKYRLLTMNGQYVSALGVMNKMRGYLDYILDEGGSEQMKLPAGIYNLSLLTASKESIFIRSVKWFLPNADTEKGRLLLESNVNAENVFLRTESAYFLMRYYLDYEQDLDMALKYANILVDWYPENLVYQYFRLLIQKKQNCHIEQYVSEMESYISESDSLTEQQKTHFLMELSTL
jgi:hypothetical protein